MIFFQVLLFLSGLATIARSLTNSSFGADDIKVASSRRIQDTFVEKTLCRNNDNSTELKVFSKTADGLRDLYRCVNQLGESTKSTILVTGGAGFLGSHLVDSLMLEGHQVIVLDNFFTGRKSNVEHWLGHPSFKLIESDVVDPIQLDTKIDQIYHLASPASPAHYLPNPIKTIRTNTIGTLNILDLAKSNSARLVLASTSEIYGDPEVHPQPESYWGNANPVGPRSCYDESKRVGESMAMAYLSEQNVSVVIARIFNTFGPRMQPDDGRVVSNFISQTVSGSPITVYGSGNQTRSFQYVSDLVVGLKKLVASNLTGVFNLGNPQEISIHSLALMIREKMNNSKSKIIFRNLPTDDPHRRRPDISKAIRLLHWTPIVTLDSGLNKTIDYFMQELKL